MLSVIGAILKIIGLLLLGIIGLLLLIVLVVLLVPIRYRAEAAMADKKPEIRARISWILRFICVRVCFADGKLHYLVKICGFTVLDSDKPKPIKDSGSPKAKKSETKKTESRRKKENTETVKPKEVNVPKEANVPKEVTKTSAEKNTKKPQPVRPEAKVQKAKKTEPETDEQNSKKESVLKKIKSLKAKADELLNYLQSPEGKKLMAFLKRKIFRLLRHLKPKALRINARIGLSNPATTGKILGIAYMLYPVYGEHIQLVGEFEEEVIEGDLYIKGRLRLGTIVLIALQILINKEVRKWIKKATGGNRK